jgi:putative solute:sodium symporter small subunit
MLADPPEPGTPRDAAEHACLRRYWRTNLAVMAVLLAIWAVVGLGGGVLWADALNAYRLPGTGYPLGFWFAQQGSIATFVILVLAYCVIMNRVDRRHHEELRRLREGDRGDRGDARGAAAR